MFENVDGRTDNGRRSRWYTISSPISSGELNAKTMKKHGCKVKISKILNFTNSNLFCLKLQYANKTLTISIFNSPLSLDKLKINQRSYHNLSISGAQNPEFRNDPESFQPCLFVISLVEIATDNVVPGSLLRRPRLAPVLKDFT